MKTLKVGLSKGSEKGLKVRERSVKSQGNFEKDLDWQPWCKSKPTNLANACLQVILTLYFICCFSILTSFSIFRYMIFQRHQKALLWNKGLNTDLYCRQIIIGAGKRLGSQIYSKLFFSFTLRVGLLIGSNP